MSNLNAVVAALLTKDFYSFVRAAFSIVSSGKPMLGNWHLEAIAFELERVLKGEIRRLIITVPPRSLKSICASVALPAFALGQDPTRRIICVSYSDLLARKHANDTRALMRSPLYRWLFGRTVINPSKDTETEVMTTLRGYRLATSVGGTLTGRGGDTIIIDDPLKPQDAHSESAREGANQWYSNTLLSRLDNKSEGSIIVVMQRLHMDDLVGYLLGQGAWTHLDLPAIAEEDTTIQIGKERWHARRRGDLLHPERESKAALDDLRANMGSMEFSAQYQQAPVPAEGNLIKWKWFESYDGPPAPLPGDRLIISWDTAQSSKELADYSACVVLLVRKGKVFILDVLRDHLEYPELKRAILSGRDDWRRTYRNYELIIEEKGSGLSLMQDLRREHVNAIGIRPERDKTMRMAAQAAHIESGAVHLPSGAPWLDEFRKEVLAFPGGRHDDQVDALSQGLQRAFAPPTPVASWGVYSMFGGRSTSR